MHNAFLLPNTDARWMSFIEHTPSANIFHHPAWSRLIAECYHFRPQTMVLTDSQNIVVAGLPIMELPALVSGVHWQSLPFTDHCFPLYQEKADCDQLLSAILESARQQRINEVGFRGELFPNIEVHQTREYTWHMLRLEDEFTAVTARIHPMHRRNARTAEKRGVQISWGNSENDIETFYQLHLKERHRQGIPVQPKRFFHLIGKYLFNAGLGSILFAQKDDRVIAGLLFLKFGQTLTYKFGASEKSALANRPNDLLFWTAIQWGCENQYRFLDMGRSDPGNLGLIQFKQGWGADELPLRYFSTSHNVHGWFTGKKSDFLKNVIRNSPPWVCRFIGELFYKYAG